jgi:hypothetical protein
MDSKAIKAWQARAICEALFPGTNYLVRLRRRMEQIGFPPDDDLYRHVCAAHDAVNQLRMKTHYMACSGAGAPPSFGTSS